MNPTQLYSALGLTGFAGLRGPIGLLLLFAVMVLLIIVFVVVGMRNLQRKFRESTRLPDKPTENPAAGNVAKADPVAQQHN